MPFPKGNPFRMPYKNNHLNEEYGSVKKLPNLRKCHLFGTDGIWAVCKSERPAPMLRRGGARIKEAC